MADGVGPGSYRAGSAGNGILPDTVGPRRASGNPSSTSALSAAIPGTRGWGSCHVQFLLMAEKKIAASKATRTVGALKGLLFGMRPLMALQVLQPGERSTTGGADMGPGLVSLGGRNIPVCLVVGVGLSGVVFGCRRCKNNRLDQVWTGKLPEANQARNSPAMFPGTSLMLARSSILGLVFWATIDSNNIARGQNQILLCPNCCLGCSTKARKRETGKWRWSLERRPVRRVTLQDSEKVGIDHD